MQTRELCSGSVLQERAAGASSLKCTGLYTSVITKLLKNSKWIELVGGEGGKNEVCEGG